MDVGAGGGAADGVEDAQRVGQGVPGAVLHGVDLRKRREEEEGGREEGCVREHQ